MNIKVHDNIDSSFATGNVVFRIEESLTETDSRKQIGIVNTKEDYELKLCTHIYNPLLFICQLPIRLAYLYGCLNSSFSVSQDNYYFFSWRRIGETNWHDWFTVCPYLDSVYGEI